MTVVDGRREKGRKTRESILEVAVNIGSGDGLEGLTLGRLAEHSGVSKSGLFAHFHSKEALQIETVEHARAIFIREAITPALNAPEGAPRLRAALDAWLDYFRRDVFPGGCFFQAASLEFDARPGPVRDLVAEIMQDWLNWLEQLASRARLPRGVDGAQLAFELNAIGLAANWQRQLFRNDRPLDRAAASFERLLKGVR